MLPDNVILFDFTGTAVWTCKTVWAWESFVPMSFYLFVFHQAIEQVTTIAVSAESNEQLSTSIKSTFKLFQELQSL